VIEVLLGDLAAVAVSAVLRPVAADWAAVTPASRRLEVRAGAVVVEQCRRQGELPVGSAVITAAGGAAAEFLVHVVVRSAEEPVSAAGVRRALQNGLRRLADWGIREVALPPLGTGAGNLDAEEAAALMVPLLAEQVGAAALERVVIVAESEYERDVFLRALSPG
jgi:O-acetyl-ADP-ribose deacetylase (regulator of RNase III)